MTHRVHPDAEIEFEAAFRHYREISENLGSEFLAATLKALADIIARPLMWPKVEHSIRRRIIRRFSIGILYDFSDDEIFIVAFMHLKRKPYYWRERIE